MSQSVTDAAAVPLLEVSQLTVRFGRRQATAVAGISFTVAAGERVGLVGESGSGKSVTALAVMGLLPETAAVTGSIRWRGRELIGVRDRDMASLRGREVGMVFQEPMTALDPLMTCGRQVAEVLRLHHGATNAASRPQVLQMLRQCGLTDPPRIADSFPHQLSGGQRQRVLMAMALINQPALVICDEPTTALDVTVQAHVLATVDDQLAATGAACLFISHDLAVISQMCHRVIVLRGGRIVEAGRVDEVLGHPQHPYTQGLLATAALDHVEPGTRLPQLEDYIGAAADTPADTREVAP